MSSLGSFTQPGTAWLRDEERTVGLRVRERAAEPGRHAFFAPDFALSDPTPWLIGQPGDGEAPNAPEPLPELTHRVDPSPSAFARLFEDITARLARDEFRKVVPVVSEELRFARALNLAMFPRARSGPPPGQYGYGFALGDEGLCGFTPELLFEVRGRRLRTMALAGTGPVGGPDLRDDPKERREHAIVVDQLAADLAGFGRVAVGTTAERAFGALKHLHTPIEVDLSRAPSFLELVVRLHPTAALGGYPRRPAIEWLEAQDFHVARRRFGAPFGYVDGDDMTCVVAIRGLQWSGDRLWVTAGCGVVEGSVVEREWRELQLKREACWRNMGLEP